MLVRGAGLTLNRSQYLIEQIHAKTNIRVKPYTQVVSAHGTNHLEPITTVTRPPDAPESRQTHNAKALFIMIGAVAETDWLPPQFDRDINGYVCTGRDLSRWPLDRGPFALKPASPASSALAMSGTVLSSG